MNPRIFNIMEEKEEEELKLLEDKIKRLKEKYEQQKKILYWNMKISKKELLDLENNSSADGYYDNEDINIT